MLSERFGTLTGDRTNKFAGLPARLGPGQVHAIARPFSWNFTHNDLEDLLHRVDAH